MEKKNLCPICAIIKNDDAMYLFQVIQSNAADLKYQCMAHIAATHEMKEDESLFGELPNPAKDAKPRLLWLMFKFLHTIEQSQQQ